MGEASSRSTAIAPRRCWASAHRGRLPGREHLLQQGDLVLAIDGKLVTRFREVERAVGDKEQVKLTVWRGHGEQTMDVDTVELPGADIDGSCNGRVRRCRRRIAR